MTLNSSYPKGQRVLVVPSDRLGTIVGFQYVVRTSTDTLEVVDESQVIAHCDHGILLGARCEACMGMAPDVVVPHGGVMMTTHDLDLDVLAEWVNHELESYSTRTNTFRLADVLALIQRLREAEAALWDARSERDAYMKSYSECVERRNQLERGLTDIKHVAEHNAAVNGKYVFGIAVAALAAVEEEG